MAVSTVGGCGQATGQHLRNSPLNEIDPERYLGTIEVAQAKFSGKAANNVPF